MVSLSTESVQEWFDDQLDITAKNELSNTLNNPDIIGKYFSELDQEQQDLVLGAYLQMARPDLKIPELEGDIEAGGYLDDNQPNSDKGWKSFPSGTSHFESKATEEIEYTGGDYCGKCGTEFEDRGECKKCDEQEAKANEDGTSDGAKKGWWGRKLSNAPTVHDEEPTDTSKFQNVIESKVKDITDPDYEMSEDGMFLGDKEGGRWWKEDNTNYEPAQHNEVKEEDNSDEWLHRMIYGDDEESEKLFSSRTVPSKKFSKKDSGESKVKANEAYREYFSDANGEDLARISQIAEMSGNYQSGKGRASQIYDP